MVAKFIRIITWIFRIFLLTTFFLASEIVIVKAKTYYISSSIGSDTYTEIQAQNSSTPWKSIDQLNTFFPNLDPGDSVLFKKGDVFNGSIIVSKSGIPFLPIVLAAYGIGPNPVINGLISLSSWTEIGEGIYAASCSTCPPDLNQLIINDVQQPLGRFPNTEYLNYEAHENNSSITDNELPASPHWSNAEVVIRKNRWIIDRIPILSHVGTKINYKSGTKYAPKAKFGYFIQNHPNTLDRIGEWYFDPVDKYLQVFFGDENPDSYELKTSVLSSLLNVKGQSHIVFENLVFKGANRSTLKVSNSQYISIRNCQIVYSGGDAVTVNWSPHFTIENSHISNSLNNSITLDQGCTSAVVRNNIIKNTGLIPGMGESGSGTYQGIMSFGANTLIEGNTIDSVGYNGIYFGGHLSQVQNNFINNFCLVKDDGGGIYVGDWFESSGKKITGNMIINGKGVGEGTNKPFYKNAHGIYIDEPSAAIEIMNNTVANCGDSGINIHNANNLIIKNNTLYNNGIQLNVSQDNLSPSHLIRNVDLTHNIFFSKEVFQPTANFFSVSNDIDDFGKSEGNYHVRPLGNNISITTEHKQFGKKDRNVYNLDDWNKYSGKDILSSTSPIKIPYYKIKNLEGPNKINGGNFTSDAWNAYAWSEDNNAEVSWDATGKINGGSLKISYNTPSEITTMVHVGITNIGTLDSGKNYLLKFKTAGNPERINIGVFLQQNITPFYKLTPIQYITLSAAQDKNEVLFSHPMSESNANLIFQLNEANGPIWFDDIELHAVDVNITDPDDHIRFEYNATNEAKTIQLDRPYVDAKDTPYQTNITLQPWTSAVLIATDKPAEKTSQSISFPALQDRNYGDFPFELKATSSSGLAVLYNIISGPAVVSGNQVAVTGFGTVTIEASQPGDSNYAAASPVTRSFNVIKSDIDNRNAQELLRINSGGPSFYFGNEQWAADKYFEGGKVYQVSNRDISNTDNDVLYLSERYGNFSYMLPVPEVALYKVELHFAEIHWNRNNARIFDLEIENGQYTMDNIDLYKLQGGLNAASVFVAENIEVTDGFLNINLIKEKDNAKISGIVLYKQMAQPNFKLAQSQIASFNNEIAELWESDPNLDKTEVKLYPNPTKEKLFIEFVVEKSGVWEIALVNPTGTSILLGNRNLELGKHTLSFDLSAYQLSAGSYFLRLTNERSNSKVVSVIIF